MATERNIYARIQQAYKAIAAKGFSKSGKVETKGEAQYNFIPIGQILEAVRRAQADAGITVIFGRPEYDHDNHEKRWEYKKKKYDMRSQKEIESTWYAAVGHLTVRLYGADADDYIELEIPFEAQDNSDKLTNKIITNAERTLYRTLYSIDEGSEDPEAFNYPMEPEEPTPARAPVNDPFFGGAPKKPAPKAEASTDRPREVMVDTICKMNNTAAMRPIVKEQAKKYGDDIDSWTDEEVKAAYKAVIEAGRAME